MLETLISSKTRIKLLLKFFLNSNTSSYLRGMEQEFGDSTNSIRLELNRLEKAGMLVSSNMGNKKIFKANTSHPLYEEVHRILIKYIDVDRIIEKVVKNLGYVTEVFLVGNLSRGIDSKIIDLVFVGEVEKTYLINLIEKVETLITRKIRYIILDQEESQELNKMYPNALLLWSKHSIQ